MEVYAQEIIDGLEDQVLSKTSIAYTTSININDEDTQPVFKKDDIDSAVASQLADLKQSDLFYLDSILASTGWNLNDDFFSSEELWKARNTPAHKQFNYMHDEFDIIGHIIANKAVDFNGAVILDSDTLPEEFSIQTSAVIYKAWSDPDQSARIANLIQEIKENKWFVSMECMFPRFDYVLKNEAGEVRIVERSEATAFMTKYLRAYGGTGSFQNYKVGRVLRDLIFSGKGLVNKPANPRSVILQDNEISYAIKQENEMTVENKDLDQAKSELVDVKAELLQAKATIADLNDVKSKLETAEATIATKTEELVAAQAELAKLQESVTSLEATVKTLETEKSEAEAKVAKAEAEAKTQKRKTLLAEAGMEEAEVETTLATFDGVDDKAFEHMVALMKKNKNEKMKQDDEEEDDSASALETAEELDDAEASLTETGEEDSSDKLRAEAISIFTKAFANARNK